MAEKATLPDTEHNHGTQSAVAGRQIPRPDDALSKPRINGGLQAWLSVLALFCVFVNSW